MPLKTKSEIEALLDALPQQPSGEVSRVHLEALMDWVEQGTKLSTEPNGFPDRTECTLSWDDGTRTLTIAPVGDSFTFYSQGVRFEKTAAETKQIPDEEGEHWIYYDENGALQTTGTFEDAIIQAYALVGHVYWDADNNNVVPDVVEERHGASMSPYTHMYLHLTVGTRYEAGMGLTLTSDGDGSAAGDIQFAAGAGYLWDEDIRSAVASRVVTDEFYMVYKDGAAGNWRRGTKSNLLGLTAGTGRLAWNEWTGATWQLSEASNNSFVLAHIFSIPGISENWVAVVGQATYNNAAAARQGATAEVTTLDLSGWPWSEGILVGTVIMQTSNGYTNDNQAKVVPTDEGDDYVDWRDVKVSAGAAAVVHNLTPGLQGGTTDEYYHLTLAQHTELAALATLLSTATTGQTLVKGTEGWELTGP